MPRSTPPAALLLAALLVVSLPASAAQVTLVMPLNRTAYQTNETIDLSVVRSDAQALAAGDLLLTVTGDDASKLTFTFPVKAAAVAGSDARPSLASCRHRVRE